MKIFMRKIMMLVAVVGMLSSLKAAGYQVLCDAYKKMGINGADITKYVEQVDESIKKLEMHVLLCEASGKKIEKAELEIMVEKAVMQGLRFTSHYRYEEKEKLKRIIALTVQTYLSNSEVPMIKNGILEVLLECLRCLWGQDLRDKPYIRNAGHKRLQCRWELKRYKGLTVSEIEKKDAAFYSKFDQESDTSEDDDYDNDMIEDDQALAASY